MAGLPLIIPHTFVHTRPYPNQINTAFTVKHHPIHFFRSFRATRQASLHRSRAGTQITMGKLEAGRRAAPRRGPARALSGVPPRRCKGRARTRASGTKLIHDPQGDDRRLEAQLKKMGLYAANTLGDGNCLFRALADQLYGSPDAHARIRAEVCTYLAQHEARYKAFVDTDEEESWETHLQQMAKHGTYGGHLELSAFANLHRRPIKIIQPGMVYVISHEDESPGAGAEGSSKRTRSKGKSTTLTSEPTDSNSSTNPLYLVYHQWEHYSSVRNLQGPHTGLPRVCEIRQVHPCEEDHFAPSGENTSEESHGESPVDCSPDNDSAKAFLDGSPEPEVDKSLQAQLDENCRLSQLKSIKNGYRECSPISATSGASQSSSASSHGTKTSDHPPWKLRPRSQHTPVYKAPVIQNGGKMSKKELRQARKRQARRQQLMHESDSKADVAHPWSNGIETACLFKELKV